MSIAAQGNGVSIRTFSSQFKNSLDDVIRSRSEKNEATQTEQAKERTTFRQKIGSAFSRFGQFAATKAKHAGQDFRAAYAGFMLSRHDRHDAQRIEDYTQYLAERGYDVTKLADDHTKESKIAALEQRYEQTKAAEQSQSEQIQTEAAEPLPDEAKTIVAAQKPAAKLTQKQQDLRKGTDIFIRSFLPKMQAHLDMQNDPNVTDEQIDASVQDIIRSLQSAGYTAKGLNGQNSHKILQRMEANIDKSQRNEQRAGEIMDKIEQPAAAEAEATL